MKYFCNVTASNYPILTHNSLTVSQFLKDDFIPLWGILEIFESNGKKGMAISNVSPMGIFILLSILKSTFKRFLYKWIVSSTKLS